MFFPNDRHSWMGVKMKFAGVTVRRFLETYSQEEQVYRICCAGVCHKKIRYSLKSGSFFMVGDVFAGYLLYYIQLLPDLDESGDGSVELFTGVGGR